MGYMATYPYPTVVDEPTCWIVSLFWEWDGLDVVVELEGHINLDQADVVDDDAGIVILKTRPV